VEGQTGWFNFSTRASPNVIFICCYSYPAELARRLSLQVSWPRNVEGLLIVVAGLCRGVSAGALHGVFLR
jgi:hypothetical protein